MAKNETSIVSVRLDAQDLDRLEADIARKRLPRAAGFIFGEPDGSQINDDLAFSSKARAALCAGATGPSKDDVPTIPSGDAVLADLTVS